MTRPVLEIVFSSVRVQHDGCRKVFALKVALVYASVASQTSCRWWLKRRIIWTRRALAISCSGER